ncbi:hypothetical protein CR513_12327, partial [Mucuna pruriens]
MILQFLFSVLTPLFGGARCLNEAWSIERASNSNTYSNLGLTNSNKLELMENQDRTLKELGTLDVVHQPWCIEYPHEDPHKHLKEFHVVCSTMRPQGIPEDYIKMKAFLFSLDGAAKDWLYLQPALFNTWGDIKCTFLEKFFLVSRTTTIQKEICGIQQHVGETLHEYWERFNTLFATCPHHQISEQLLIQYFYEGLIIMGRSRIDVANGGALIDKTTVVARHLISNMESNTQQFETRGAVTNKVVNEVGTVDNLILENKLTELTSLVRKIAVGQHQQIPPVKIYGICTSMEHLTDMCPILWKPIRSTAVSNSKVAIVQVESKSRAIRSPKIWIRAKHASFESQLLPIVGTELSSATIPTITITNADTKQLAIHVGMEEISIEHERHNA